MSATIFHFHNNFHIGDNLCNLKYFLYISPILKEKNYIIYYYYNTDWPYNKETTLLSYVDPATVVLKPIREKPAHSIVLHMGNNIGSLHYYPETERYFDFFYKKILQYMNITDLTISTNMWLPEPFLLPIYDTLEPKFKDVDILILNNPGHSGQGCNITHVNDLAKYLSHYFKIVTSEPVNDSIPCARTLSLKEIGAVSTHSRYVISSCSGPQIPCFNLYAKECVKKWFFICNLDFKFYSIDYVHTTSISPIKHFFDTLIAK
jgi:hypothetical protein